MKTRTIRVNYLARVEGEGGLYVKIRGNTVVDVKLKIFEPPRFFEAFLRGRSCEEAPDITSRICGICPVAYQMSAVHAIEDALGWKGDGQLRALRRLAYCGEWIQSHTLHVYLLHAPDFLGYPDAIQMARDHPEIVQRGLKLKKAGNGIMRVVGGREVHPINTRIGGFYKAPAKKSLRALTEQLKWSREAALETIRWAAGMPFPDFEQDFVFVGLRHENEYPFNEGRIVSSRGLDIGAHDFEQHFTEEHISYSTALHSTLDGQGGYLVGPLARYNLNFDRLSAVAREAALGAGLQPVCRNPFQSIVVRSVEILQACDEALRIIDQYELPESPAMEIRLKAGTGYGCTEAPRGILYHRYRFDEHGTILDAKIIPPTSQNQKAIEDDLKQFVSRNVALPEEDLQGRCEQVVRNYDPCISCSTHFLKLRIDRN
jgi:coenzyme F420-reducing hydrogenase alpha subunit